MIVIVLLAVACLAPSVALARQPATPGTNKARAGTKLGSLNVGGGLTPMFGYESNYRYTSGDIEGSAVFAAGGELDLKYRRGKSLRVSGGLGGSVLVPLSDAALTEFLLEVPALLLYRPVASLELFISNHVGFERSRVPPVFSVLNLKAGETPSSIGLYETFRPALADHFLPGLYLELGPYFRYKQMNQPTEDTTDEDFYLYVDAGGDVSLKYIHKDRFAARVRFDYARRMFVGRPNVSPRNADYTETLSKDDELIMNRVLASAYLRARVWGPLSMEGSYTARIVRDTGGFYSYNEHLARGGIGLSWPDRFSLNASVSYQTRGYTKRTECEGGACAAGAAPQIRREHGLYINARAEVPVTGWLEAVASYALQDPGADTGDPMASVHTVLGGASFFF